MKISVTVIERTGRKFLECRWIDPKTGLKRTKSTKTKRRRDAERLAAKLEEDLNGGKTVFRIATWEEFQKEYESTVYPSQKAKTKSTTQSTFNLIRDVIHPARATSIESDDVRKLASHLRERGVSEFTVARHLTELRKILRWGLAQKFLKELPAISVPRPKGRKGRDVTAEEFERMLMAATAILPEGIVDGWKFYLNGLWWGGLRLVESLLLDWEDDTHICVEIDRRRPMFRIQATDDKGGRFRMLPMAPEFAELLRTVPAAERTGTVFQPHSKIGPFVPLPNHVSRIISAIGEKAGVKVMERGESVKSEVIHRLCR